MLQPGRLSPTRQVPAEITRPEYVGKKRPKTGEPDVKTPEIIERMRVAGKLAARALGGRRRENRLGMLEPGVLAERHVAKAEQCEGADARFQTAATE